MTATILLIDPKYGHNLGAAVRAAATLGAERVLWTGDRIDLTSPRGRVRLPREERLRQYHVTWERRDRTTVFDQVSQSEIPVALEYDLPGAEWLPEFEHPERACYVFGPEDGALGASVLRHCHRFVRIPSRGCVNLGAAVYLTLYDRRVKRGWQP
jgi:tRNA(Leu) C34 or U34 (ribose-2'-O)-methylase TrmL